MDINRVDNVKFTAGKINLKRIDSDRILSYDALKKIAEDKGIDIFISKNKETKYLPKEDMYMVVASKETPIVTRGFFAIGKKVTSGASCLISGKEIQKEELAVRIYNATITAIDNLEKKLMGKK